MKYFLLLIFGFLAYSSALVHFWQDGKGKNGCKVNSTELAVGGEIQDPNVCGIIQCQNKKGDCLIYYCQYPPTFGGCQSRGIATYIDFPECCWYCTLWGTCDSNGNLIKEEKFDLGSLFKP